MDRPSSCFEFKVKSEDVDLRLDFLIASNLEKVSRADIKKMILSGNVTVNHKPVLKPSFKLSEDDTVSIFLSQAQPAEPLPEEGELDIVYEDDDIAVINKPAYLRVHPAGKIFSNSLVNRLLYRYPDTLSLLAGKDRPGIVHRLDKDSSGLILIARTDIAYERLTRAFASREVEKFYLAVIKGSDIKDEKDIVRPIGRSKKNRLKQTIDYNGGKYAFTRIRLLQRMKLASILDVKIETGRTHQIRVHLASIGYPILGDELYCKGRGKFPIKRQALHAYKIGFKHPVTGDVKLFTKEPPSDIKELITRLGGDISAIEKIWK